MSENYRRPGEFNSQSRWTKRRRLLPSYSSSSESSDYENAVELGQTENSVAPSPEHVLPLDPVFTEDNFPVDEAASGPTELESQAGSEIDLQFIEVFSDGDYADSEESSSSDVPSDTGTLSDEDDGDDDPGYDDSGDVIEAAAVVERELRDWALEHNITLSALGDLARRLRDCHPQCFQNLHIDARTILETPRGKVELVPVPPGHLKYVGIKEHLPFILTHIHVGIVVIFMLFNVDGLSLRNSSFSELWLIVMYFPVFRELLNSVFPIGLYGGPGKPKRVEIFLRLFVDELLELLESGFHFQGRHYEFRIPGFSCDAPAREFIMGTKGHGGYSCCSRCKIEGITYEGKRVYLETDKALRTDEEFRSRADPEYRHPDVSTPLEEIEQIDFGRMFVLDSMHLFFQGLCKTLLQTWLNGGRPHKFSVAQCESFFNRIKALKDHMPNVFQRKLQGMAVKKKTGKVSLKWKATEYRSFLLYVGPVILKDYLSPAKCDHFLQLHIATTIVFCSKYCADPELLQYARRLFLYFIQSGQHPDYYGPELMVINFHSLLHVVDDVEYFSQFIPDFLANDISAFPPENFYGIMKRLATRGPARELQQLVKRLIEKNHGKAAERLYGSSEQPQLEFRISHKNGPFPLFCTDPQYKKAILPNFTFSTANEADCYCGLESGTIVKIEKFAFSESEGEVVLIGKSFTDLTSFFGEPHIDSSCFGIFKGTRLSDLRWWKISKISTQYAAFPDGKGHTILYPLLHCLKLLA